MLLLRSGETFEVEENGLMLAAFSFAAYTNAIRELKAGDRRLLSRGCALQPAYPQTPVKPDTARWLPTTSGSFTSRSHAFALRSG
jgi:hypothetical protein